MAYKYIDVSYHNGVIDWEKVKSQVDFVIIRAGYGANNVDQRFVHNITECNRLGIPCGVYWFSYALEADMAAEEARYCLEAIKPYRVELPVCYDFEYDSVNRAKRNGVTITSGMATSFVHAFCGAVEAAGYYAMNYANPDYLSRYFDDSTLKYDLWLAQWPLNPNPDKPPRSCGIWQYTSRGSIDGISGMVDVGAVYRDYPDLIASKGLNGLAAAEPDKPWYADAQAWAVDRGITDGTDPDGPVTRAQAWTMLYRALK